MIKNAFYNGLADMVTLVAGLVASVVATRTLGSEEWGIYSQVSWLVGLLSSLLGLGLNYTIMRYVAAFSQRRNFQALRSLFFWVFLIQLVVATCGSLIVFLLAETIVRTIGWSIDPRLLKVAAISILASALVQLTTSALRGLQQFRSISVIATVSALLSLMLSLLTLASPYALTMAWINAILQSVMVPLVLSTILFGLRSLDFSKAEEVGNEQTFPWREIVNYSGLVYLSSIADQIIWQRSEILFLARLDNPNESGYYSIAYSLATLGITTIPVALAGTLTPLFTALRQTTSSSDELAIAYRRAFNYICFIALPSTVGLIAVAESLVRTVYGAEYISATRVLQILALSAAVGIVTRPSASILHAVNRPQILLIGTVTVIPINLYLAWKLVPLWGAEGAAVANLVAQAVNALIAIVYTFIAARLNYDWVSLRNMTIGTAICGCIAYSSIRAIAIPPYSLAISTFLGVLVYIFTMLMLRDTTARQLIEQIRRRLPS